MQRLEPYTAEFAQDFERPLTEPSCRSSWWILTLVADGARPEVARRLHSRLAT